MGKLNILHHKSWHVYKRDNRLRVLKDEEDAKKQQELKLEKKLKSEREERLNLLQISKGKEEKFTLFPVQESSSSLSKKDEIKNDPWIMKLGETKSGEKSDPWYSKSDVKEFNKSDQYSIKELPKSYSSRMNKEKDQVIKFKQDPLRKIRQESNQVISKEKLYNSSKSTQDSTVQSSSTKSSSIEELRRKRIEREKLESEKSKKLLTGSSMDSRKSTDYKLHESEQGYYHSQFNRESRRKRD